MSMLAICVTHASGRQIGILYQYHIPFESFEVDFVMFVSIDAKYTTLHFNNITR